MILRRTGALLLVLLAACSGPQRFVHLETGEGETSVHIPLTAEVEPVKLEGEEFRESLERLAREVRLTASPRETVWRMFELDVLSGDSLYLPRDRKLVPMGSGTPLEGVLTEEDAENIVSIKGHKGPHPERYHRLVHERLDRATRTCRSMVECRARLTRALEKLAEEIGTPGTELNQLVTQGKPR